VSPGEATVRPIIILCTRLAASFASALPARAQDNQVDDYDVFQSVLTNVAPVAVSQLPAKCMAFGTGWFHLWHPADRARTDVSCRLTETKELRRVGVRWRFARYRRRWVMPPIDRRNPGYRPVREEEVVVLFSQATEGGRLRPEWTASYGPDFIAEVHLLTAPAAGGGVLLSVQECVNGTGGCRQHFILRRAGRWRPVREPWFRQLPASMRGRFWKGTYVDPVTLRGSGGLYANEDGNCCPSREVDITLALQGSSLVLRNYRVRPNPQQ
jgi:hypothetical protein